MFAYLLSVTVTITVAFQLMAAYLVAASLKSAAWIALGASVFTLMCVWAVFRLWARTLLIPVLLAQGSSFLLLLAAVLHFGVSSVAGHGLALIIAVFGLLVWPAFPLRNVQERSPGESAWTLGFSGCALTAPFLTLWMLVTNLGPIRRWTMRMAIATGTFILACVVLWAAGGDEPDPY